MSWHVLPYEIELHGSVLVGADGDPNALLSADHLPGSTVRGAFIGLDAAVSALDAAARPAWFDGDVQVLPAYPVCARMGRGRALPTPRSWRVRKGLGEAVDLAAGPGDDAADWVRVAGSFVVGALVGAGAVEVGDTPRWRRPRTAVGETHQRALDAEGTVAGRVRDRGALFLTEGLDPRVWFAGAVVSRDAGALARIRDLVGREAQVWLGRNAAHRGRATLRVGRHPSPVAGAEADDAPFGAVPVQVYSTEGEWDADADPWVAHDGLSDALDPPGVWSLVLLSDAVFADSLGHPDLRPVAVVRALGERFAAEGLGGRGVPRLADDGRPVAWTAQSSAESSAAVVGGRRTSEPTLARGTVVCVQLPALSERERAALCAGGLGERTEDGLGRFALVSPEPRPFTVGRLADAAWRVLPAVPVDPPAPTPYSDVLYHRLVVARKRDALFQEVGRRSAPLAVALSASTLGALRTASARAARTAAGWTSGRASQVALDTLRQDIADIARRLRGRGVSDEAVRGLLDLATPDRLWAVLGGAPEVPAPDEFRDADLEGEEAPLSAGGRVAADLWARLVDQAARRALHTRRTRSDA